VAYVIEVILYFRFAFNSIWPSPLHPEHM